MQRRYGLRSTEFWADWRAGDASATFDAMVSLVAYAGMHAGCVGVVVNTFVFWVFGGRLEMYAGAPRFGLFALTCTVGGGVAHAWFDQASTAPMLGGGALTAGAVAAYLVRLWNGRVTVLIPPLWVRISAPAVALGWVLLQFYPVQRFLTRGEGEPLGYFDLLAAAGVGLVGSAILWPRRTTS